MLYKLFIYLFVLSSKICICDRRITNGKSVDNGKKYMVYLLNSKYSVNQPDAWLCGGVLISTVHVLTAAACLTEVTHMYVIAGYKKYVSGKDIQNDECTRTRKQRIVKIIIPKAFNASTWMKYDVGLGVVEKPYNFLDVSYRKVCSYEPEGIAINYDPVMEAANSVVLALGWGAAKARQPGTGADINSEYLMQAKTIVTNSTFCRKQFPKNLEYLFLCTHSLVKAIEHPVSNTTKKQLNMISSTTGSTINERHFRELWRRNCKDNGLNETPIECLEMVSSEVLFSRRELISNDSGMSHVENKNLDGNIMDINNTISRKQGVGETPFGGICQNDHGGPLIASEGMLEMVIGVALNSVYSKQYQCGGPFLYISTARSKPLIKCLLSSNKNMRKQCDAMNYEIKEYNVKWPAEQEGHGRCKDGVCRQSTVRQPALPSSRQPVNLVRPASVPPIPVNSLSVQPIPVRPRPSFNIGQIHTQKHHTMGSPSPVRSR